MPTFESYILACELSCSGRYIISNTLSQQMNYLASIDQSTTSTKFTLYHPNGRLVDQEIILHEQICSQQGWLEHNPTQIIQNLTKCIKAVLTRTGIKAEQIKGVGVTNQRQTVVGWNQNGKPYYNAIVWCDNRCKHICDKFKQQHGQKKAKTGLPVSTYFTLFKILWLRQNHPEINAAIQQDRIRFGTMDSWVIFNLTGQYVTDASNASRTFLCNLSAEWDEELLTLAGLTRNHLPRIVDSFENIGLITQGPLKGVPICSIMGDQQSSAYAHQLALGQAKMTYGTGCFLIAPLGSQPVIDQTLITTILYRHKGQIQYGYECSIECGGGTINWAKRLGFFNSYQQLDDWQDVSKQDVYFFPSFGDIYAPFWRSGATGGILGLSLATTPRQIMGALLESLLFRVQDNLKSAAFANVKTLYVDGGLTVNTKLMQVQSDLVGKLVAVRERDTCWGVAKGVLVSNGQLFPGFQGQKTKIYEPNTQNEQNFKAKYARWCKQRSKAYGWACQ